MRSVAGAFAFTALTACSQNGAVSRHDAAAFRSAAKSMYLAFDSPCVSPLGKIDAMTSELFTRMNIEAFEMHAYESQLAQDLITAKAAAYYERRHILYECVPPEDEKSQTAMIVAKNRETAALLERLDAMLPRVRREGPRS